MIDEIIFISSCDKISTITPFISVCFLPLTSKITSIFFHFSYPFFLSNDLFWPPLFIRNTLSSTWQVHQYDDRFLIFKIRAVSPTCWIFHPSIFPVASQMLIPFHILHSTVINNCEFRSSSIPQYWKLWNQAWSNRQRMAFVRFIHIRHTTLEFWRKQTWRMIF